MVGRSCLYLVGTSPGLHLRVSGLFWREVGDLLGITVNVQVLFVGEVQQIGTGWNDTQMFGGQRNPFWPAALRLQFSSAGLPVLLLQIRKELRMFPAQLVQLLFTLQKLALDLGYECGAEGR